MLLVRAGAGSAYEAPYEQQYGWAHRKRGTSGDGMRGPVLDVLLALHGASRLVLAAGRVTDPKPYREDE
ncbi:hypothetical protein ACIPC1_08675 [Streptomyces sp. NPDC087263]|uniref:hypothetical protein n=1 Tax=Streptomyces sp. NPDC087263 TaxID=3365773 RepID=UPI0038192E65